MAKCVYDGKGYLPECEHCIDTVGTGVVCTHDCVIELREEIEKRDAVIKELAGAVDENMTAQCEHCDLRQACQEGEDGIVVPCNQVIKLREALKKAREVING